MLHKYGFVCKLSLHLLSLILLKDLLQFCANTYVSISLDIDLTANKTHAFVWKEFHFPGAGTEYYKKEGGVGAKNVLDI